MKPEIPAVGGEEQDALSPWKKVLRWKAGERRYAKKKYNRRLRKQIKGSLKEALTLNNDF